jgi:hypothetical protein
LVVYDALRKQRERERRDTGERRLGVLTKSVKDYGRNIPLKKDTIRFMNGSEFKKL